MLLIGNGRERAVRHRGFYLSGDQSRAEKGGATGRGQGSQHGYVIRPRY